MYRTIRCGFFALACVLLSIAAVHAQDTGDNVHGPVAADAVFAPAAFVPAPAVPEQIIPAPPPAVPVVSTRGPVASAIIRTLERQAMLNVLTASYEVLQAADVVTTTLALRAGSREQNPILRGFAHHPIRLALVKGSVTTASLILTHRIVKRHRLGGALLLAGLNGTLAIIVARNMQADPAR